MVAFTEFSSRGDYVYAIETLHRRNPGNDFVLDWDVDPTEQRRIRRQVRLRAGSGFDVSWAHRRDAPGLQVVDAIAYTALQKFEGTDNDLAWEYISDQVLHIPAPKKVRTP